MRELYVVSRPEEKFIYYLFSVPSFFFLFPSVKKPEVLRLSALLSSSCRSPLGSQLLLQLAPKTPGHHRHRNIIGVSRIRETEEKLTLGEESEYAPIMTKYMNN